MLVAAIDWQPLVNGAGTLLSAIGAILIGWLIQLQRVNNRDTRTARNASLATAAAAGVTVEQVPEVRPMTVAINGSGLSSRVTMIEKDSVWIKFVLSQMAEHMRRQGATINVPPPPDTPKGS